jgi:hypothetical protein
MRLFIALLIGFYSLNLLASTTATFPGFTGYFGMIVLESHNSDGSNDPGPLLLLNQMQVPTEDSMLGPGKSIKTQDQDLTFICASRTNGSKTCSINLKKSSFAFINPIQKKMSYKISGSAASSLIAAFLKPGEKEFKFESQDQKFKLNVNQDKFELIYE